VELEFLRAIHRAVAYFFRSCLATSHGSRKNLWTPRKVRIARSVVRVVAMEFQVIVPDAAAITRTF
jgi:hypothetical protein